MSFASLGLIDPLLRNLQDLNYQAPTPVQAKAIPAVLGGKDVMAGAQTGTGKTAGFALPLLQRLGVDVLDERPSEIVRPDGLRCWTYDFGLRMDVATHAALADRPQAEVAAQFTAAFAAAWRGEAETDGFSALVLRTGLSWREVAVLRAYGAEVVITDTLPIAEDRRFPQLTVLSIAPLIARAIREVFDDGSVTSLFDGQA